MIKKTKIIATVGPAVTTKSKLEKLIRVGVDVFRFNMKHNEPEWHEEMIGLAQKAADTVKKPVGILIDLQGPEIRLKTFNGELVPVKRGDILTLVAVPPKGLHEIQVSHKEALERIEIGDKVLIDNGILNLMVTKKEPYKVELRALNNLVIKNNKAINFPGKNINIPSLIKKDLLMLDVATRKRVDFIALSFVRNASDIKILRREMAKRGIIAQVVAKIENQPALDNLAEIIHETDTVMIARGDLGVEVPIRELAFWQKKIINLCRDSNVPVIVATQMLTSMMVNPLPTRAEATDIANAVFDGTDALMLSEETAIGSYPFEAVTEMVHIAHFSESKGMVHKLDMEIKNATEAIVASAHNILLNSKSVHIGAVIVFTETGYTAKALSALRPQLPIIAVTNSQKTAEILALSYGVIPICVKFPTGEVDVQKLPLEELIDQKLIKRGMNVLVTHGVRWNQPGATNMVGILKV